MVRLMNTYNISIVSAWLFIGAASINSCIGNVLLKKSRMVATDAGLYALLFNPWLIGGMFFYGLNVILFAKALDRLPVSAAYPVLAGGGFLLLNIASHWLFGERIGATQWLGGLLVIGGLVLLTRGQG
jgi:multidrug transporter EmrE-like cation transporter